MSGILLFDFSLVPILCLWMVYYICNSHISVPLVRHYSSFKECDALLAVWDGCFLVPIYYQKC
jgi:hypothetical protein